MDTTTVVIFWDEVIEKIIVKFQELMQQDRDAYFPFLIETIFLKPLKKLLVLAINASTKVLENPYTYTFWSTIIEHIFFWLYIVLLFFLGIQFLLGLGKKIVYSMKDEQPQEILLFPLQRFLMLQCIHFIGLPILKVIIENYSNWLSELYHMLSFYRENQKLIQFDGFQLLEGGILLEVICLTLILYFCLVLSIQFIQQGIYILFYFVKCYTELFYETKIQRILDPLKALSLRMFIGFVLQRIIVMEVLYNQSGFTTTSVFVSIALLLTATQIPKFLKREEVMM